MVPRRPGLPGEFIIRTYLKNTLLTAHDGDSAAKDSVITTATSIGPAGDERFNLSSVPPGPTTIQTRGGHFLSASGGIDGTHAAAPSALQAYVTAPDTIGTAHFRLVPAILPPHGHTNISRKWPGYFTIHTSSNRYLTAVGGGGQPTGAFHTDLSDTEPAKDWEHYWILKCGDLGSGYQYAIRPAGTGSPGQPEQSWLLAHTEPGYHPVYFGFFPEWFRMLRQPDGSYALGIERRNSPMQYLTAVGGGGISNGADNNLHTDATQVQAWERFKIVDRGDCTYTFQTSGGWYLGIGPNYNISTRISDPDAAPSIGYNSRFELELLGR